MRRIWYLPTVDERQKPMIVKVNIVGERGQWRMLHVVGERYKDEGEIVVHARHITQNWMAAWMKAKRISRFRARCPERVDFHPLNGSKMARLVEVNEAGCATLRSGRQNEERKCIR